MLTFYSAVNVQVHSVSWIFGVQACDCNNSHSHFSSSNKSWSNIDRMPWMLQHMRIHSACQLRVEKKSGVGLCFCWVTPPCHDLAAGHVAVKTSDIRVTHLRHLPSSALTQVYCLFQGIFFLLISLHAWLVFFFHFFTSPPCFAVSEWERRPIHWRFIFECFTSKNIWIPYFFGAKLSTLTTFPSATSGFFFRKLAYLSFLNFIFAIIFPISNLFFTTVNIFPCILRYKTWCGHQISSDG